MVIQLAGLKKLLKGHAVDVDATTLEANAAMKSIVRKDTGEDWNWSAPQDLIQMV